jgi:hypothetical protein
MSSLRDLELEKQLKHGGKRTHEYNWTQTELIDAWRKAAPGTLNIAETLANLPDSLDVIGAAQKALVGDLASISAEEMQVFCRELRTLWLELDESAKRNKNQVRGTAEEILDKWFKTYPLSNAKYWNVFFQTGTFFPTENNWRALIARVLCDNRLYLGICTTCKRCFQKPLRKSKYCKNCRSYDNAERQRKYRDKVKTAKQGTARKSRKATGK